MKKITLLTAFIVLYSFNSYTQCPASGHTSINGLTVNFYNTSYSFNSSTWDFGDGNTSSATNPTHTYTNPGSYYITLQISYYSQTLYGPFLYQCTIGGTITVTGPTNVTFASSAGGLTGVPDIIVGDITTQNIVGTAATFKGSPAIDLKDSTGTLFNGTSLRVSGISFIGYDGLGDTNGNTYLSHAAGDASGGQLHLRSNTGIKFRTFSGTEEKYAVFNRDGSADLYYDNVLKFQTTGVGASVIGICSATAFHGDGANLTSLPAAQLTGTLPAIDGSNLLNVTAAGTGVNIQDDGVGVGAAATVINFASGLNVVASAGIATVTGSGGGAQSRNIVSGVTTSIPNLGIGNTDIIGQKSYALMKVGLSTTGWIRLYTDSTSRSNDVSRSVGEDPAPGSGVIAEVVTTGISTQQMITPFAMGGNMDEPVTNKIYVAIQNLSGSTQTITANLTILQLEA